MAQEIATDESEIVDGRFLPMYEFDADAGPVWTTGDIVCRVPTKDQKEALRSIEGEGWVVPDGWVSAYNETVVPVIGGVPIVALDQCERWGQYSEGVESGATFAPFKGISHVEIAWAGRHPDNDSKIRVRPVEGGK